MDKEGDREAGEGERGECRGHEPPRGLAFQRKNQSSYSVVLP